MSTAETFTSRDVLDKLKLTHNDAIQKEYDTSGIIPESLSAIDIKKNVMIFGITPEDFSSSYASIEFDFQYLKDKFAEYCKDFNDELQDGVASKALEFCSKILFEYGPYMRVERKGKGDKAIRFRFPYVKDTSNLRMKTVIVTTFKDVKYTKPEVEEKLILTFRQAALLAMVTFSKAIEYCYNKNVGTILLTPLCGAIFSRESIKEMAEQLQTEEVRLIQIINESSASGGQYLDNSSLACAIVCMITSTKKVTDENIRNSMISKVVKQYIHKGKEYNSTHFGIYCKHALGGVPPGLDADTLIKAYKDLQMAQVTARAQAMAIKQAGTQIIPRVGIEPLYEAAAKSTTTAGVSGPKKQ